MQESGGIDAFRSGRVVVVAGWIGCVRITCRQFPLELFELHHFLCAHSVSGAVYVDRCVSDRDRRFLWSAEPAQDGIVDTRLAGFGPPTGVASEGATAALLILIAMD